MSLLKSGFAHSCLFFNGGLALIFPCFALSQLKCWSREEGRTLAPRVRGLGVGSKRTRDPRGEGIAGNVATSIACQGHRSTGGERSAPTVALNALSALSQPFSMVSPVFLFFLRQSRRRGECLFSDFARPSNTGRCLRTPRVETPFQHSTEAQRCQRM